MKTFRAVTVLVAGLVVGGMNGCACKRDGVMKLTAQSTYADAFLGLTDAFEPLRDLRAGNADEAIEVLENRLDAGIIELSAILPEQTDSKKRTAYIRILKKVRDYRTAHPWKSTISPQVKEAAAKALANIPEEGGAR